MRAGRPRSRKRRDVRARHADPAAGAAARARAALGAAGRALSDQAARTGDAAFGGCAGGRGGGDPAETEVLEDLIVAAFNDARAKVNAHAESEMHKLTGGLALPGGMKLPF